MLSRKRIARYSAAFLTAVTTASAPMKATAATLQLYRTPQRMMDICMRFDANKANMTNDIVGLLAWDNYCAYAYRNFPADKIRDPIILQHRAVASIFMARYQHVFKRSPTEYGTDGSFNPADNDPQKQIDFARKMLDLAVEKGVRYPATEKLLADTIAFTKTPVKQQYDNSAGASCLLGAMPHQRTQYIRKIKNCAIAYNDRPLAPLAFRYADALYFYSKAVYLDTYFNTEAQASAYYARDFYTRAQKEGIDPQMMMPLTENLIDAYNTRRDNIGVLKVAGVVVAVWAAWPLISGAAGAGAGTEAAVVTGGEVSADAGMAASATNAALLQSWQTQYFLSWSARNAAAMAMVP